MVEWLQGLGGAVTVAMEATLYWAWLRDQLTAAGITAVAAHLYQVKPKLDPPGSGVQVRRTELLAT